MRVVAMFRVSTEAQATEGASLDAQERTYRDLAARNGWKTVAEFRGHESATQASADRRVLQQVLACIRDAGPDGIYVHEQSRLTRGDELEVALLLRELRERRMKIIVGGVVRDLGSIDERFMVGIQSLVDRAESERIKERMSRGKRERARQGKKTGGPAPFGYENPPPGAPGRGTLRIVEAEAAIVRKVFALAAAGKAERHIEAALNAQGAPAPRGGKWGRSTIRRILDNAAYVGTAASGVWVARGKRRRSFRLDLANDRAIVIENAHPPIIDRETWDAAHGRPRLPRTATPRMLTGLLWVGGVQYSGDTDGGTRLYRAPRGLRGHPWLEAQATDDAVWDAFASLATTPEFVQRLIDEAQSPRDQALAAQEAEYLADQVGKLERRLSRLVDMRADGEISKEAYAAKRAETEGALERLRAELVEQRAKALTLDGSFAARVVKAVQVLLAGKTRLATAQKRSILASIVKRVDVVAERSSADFARDAKGRILPKAAPRWAVRSVAFQLALPDEDATRAAVGETAANDASLAHEAGALRSGQLAKTDLRSDQLAGTGGDRAGHLDRSL